MMDRLNDAEWRALTNSPEWAAEAARYYKAMDARSRKRADAFSREQEKMEERHKRDRQKLQTKFAGLKSRDDQFGVDMENAGIIRVAKKLGMYRAAKS